MDLLNRLQSYLKPSQMLQLTVWDPDDEAVEYVAQGVIRESTGFLVRVFFNEDDFPPEAVPLFVQGVIVGVFLEVNPAPLMFYPKLHSVSFGRRTEVWLRLAPETNIEVLQNRAHVRVTMRIPFQVGSIEEGSIHPAYTVDMSGGGLKLNCDIPYEPGQMLTIQLSLFPGNNMVLKGQVISAAKNPLVQLHPQERYTLTCCFIDLEPALETLIMKECFRRELMLKNR